jgi:hypothetical protein
LVFGFTPITFWKEKKNVFNERDSSEKRTKTRALEVAFHLLAYLIDVILFFQLYTHKYTFGGGSSAGSNTRS